MLSSRKFSDFLKQNHDVEHFFINYRKIKNHKKWFSILSRAYHHYNVIQLRFPSTLLSHHQLSDFSRDKTTVLSAIYRRTVLEGHLNNYDTLTSNLVDQISNDTTSDVFKQKFRWNHDRRNNHTNRRGAISEKSWSQLTRANNGFIIKWRWLFSPLRNNRNVNYEH